MRRDRFVIAEHLQNGLRPDPRIAQGAQVLEECRGVRCAPHGISTPISVELLSSLAGSGITIDPPFPQLFAGIQFMLLADKDALYWIDAEDNLDPVDLYQPSRSPNESPDGSITSGGIWHFADAGNFWMLFNGITVVFNIPGDRVYATDSVRINSGCYHRGRVIFGGFDADEIGLFSGEYADSIMHHTTVSRRSVRTLE